MARTIYKDRMEVFAYTHPDATDAMIRALKETIELIQRPENRDVFDLPKAYFGRGFGEIRVVLPYLPEDLEDFLDDSPETEYDLREEQGP